MITKIERIIYDDLKTLLDQSKPVPFNKILIANAFFKENLFSEKNNAKIIEIYEKSNLSYAKIDAKRNKLSGENVVFYVKEQLFSYTNEFIQKASQKFKREEFPDFLLSK